MANVPRARSALGLQITGAAKKRTTNQWRPVPTGASRALRTLACAENVPLQRCSIARKVKSVHYGNVVTNWPTARLRSIPIDASQALYTWGFADSVQIPTIVVVKKHASSINAKPEVVVLQQKQKDLAREDAILYWVAIVLLRR